MPLCLKLSIIRYGSRVKLRPPLHHGIVAIEKGAFGSSSTTVANLTFFYYYTKFKTSNLIVKNNASSSKTFLNQTNVVYKITYPFRECLSKYNIIANTYIGQITTTLSRRLTYHPSVLSDIKQHLTTKPNKDTDKLKSPHIRKILINNTKIIYKNNNKNCLKILEAITIKK